MTKMLLGLLSMIPGIGRAPDGGGHTLLVFGKMRVLFAPFYQTLYSSVGSRQNARCVR